MSYIYISIVISLKIIRRKYYEKDIVIYQFIRL